MITVLLGLYLLAGAALFTYIIVPVIKVRSYETYKVLSSDHTIFAACAVFLTTLWLPLAVLHVTLDICFFIQQLFNKEPK